MSAYFTALEGTIPTLKEVLTNKKIKEGYLHFGGAGTPPVRKPTAPTDARSEFLANRAMGDWAETKVAESIRETQRYIVVPYGNTDKIAAGEAGFKERYLAGLEETRQFGKRPDLLLFKPGVDVPNDLTELNHADSEKFARLAVGSIEVRSSKFEALTYIAKRKADKELGKSAARETPSFTVKVEDLKIVYRWIERYRVPQIYAQVFFDSIYAINFLEIFRTISSGRGFTIETPENSQEKATIMISITTGTQIGSCDKQPDFEVGRRRTLLGRHDAYVYPKCGKFTIDPDKLERVLIGEKVPEIAVEAEKQAAQQHPSSDSPSLPGM